MCLILVVGSGNAVKCRIHVNAMAAGVNNDGAFYSEKNRAAFSMRLCPHPAACRHDPDGRETYWPVRKYGNAHRMHSRAV